MTIKTSRQGSVILITDVDTGELIRKDTGEAVSDDLLSQEKEWRTFEPERDSRARTGAPTSLAFHDTGLSTVIGKESTDASGNQIDSVTKRRIGRLRMLHSRNLNRSPKERSLQRAFTMLSKIKGRLGLPDYVTEKAAYVYRKARTRPYPGR